MHDAAVRSPGRIGALRASLGGLALGLAILAVTFWLIPGGWPEARALLASLEPLWLCAVAASTLLHFWLTALRWKLVADRAVGGARFPMLAYTSLTGLLAQILPGPVCHVAVRAVAHRLHDSTSIARGATVSLPELFIDLCIPALLLIPLVLCASALIDPASALALSLLLFAGVSAAAIIAGPGALAALASRVAALRIVRRAVPDDAADFRIERRLLARLLGLSGLRYANLALRVGLIALAVGGSVEPLTAALAFPLVLLSAALAVIPGQFGIAELGWIGGLKLLGVDGDAAFALAIAVRLVILGAVVAVNLGVGVGLLGLTRPRERES